MGKLVSVANHEYNRHMPTSSYPANSALPPPSIWSVSELNEQARQFLESNFGAVQVEGEIADLIQHRSGHWYFTLKDKNCELRAAMFKGQNRSVRFNPENGQQVLLTGKLTVYPQRGSYQLVASRMAPAGLGQLQQAYEALKQRLQEQGLFDPAHKKPLPPYPKQVAIITSPQGAAIRDIQTTFARRFAGIELLLIPVAVQGDGAAQSIAQAIDLANEWANNKQTGSKTPIRPDAIIVGRGGGSLEDLWAFNEQIVAEAIYRSELPIVSAVGHETDVTIADFVADIRAATPTAAAELLSPDQTGLLVRFSDLGRRLSNTVSYRIEHAQLRLNALSRRVKHPSHQLSQYAQRLDQLDLDMQRAISTRIATEQQRLNRLKQTVVHHSPARRIEQQQLHNQQLQQRAIRAIRQQLSDRQQQWQRLAGTLNAVSPLATLKRGYAIVEDEKGNIVRSSADVSVGDTVNAKLGDGSVSCAVVTIAS